jgi:hypothetical protein
MLSEEEIQQQEQRLAAYRRTLDHYLQQKALLGAAFIPPGITHGIDEARENIRQLKILLRQNGITVDEHPDDLEPHQGLTPRITFSQDQMLWLSTLLRYSPNGEKVDSRKVLVELLGSVADDFDPKSIDYHFCKAGNSITLLGRYVVNSDDRLVQQANQVALSVRNMLRANPDKRIVTVQELVAMTKLPEQEVALTLELMAGNNGGGYFHRAGTNYGPRGWASIRVDENDIFENYVKFRSIAAIVNSLLGER